MNEIMDTINNRDLPDRQEIRVLIPEESLKAVDLILDSIPYVGVFNTGIMELTHKDVFGWFLSIIIDYTHTVGDDMPDVEDTKRIQDFADLLSENLKVDNDHPNALFLGRVTGDSHTQMMWYVNDPEQAVEYLQSLIESGDYSLEFDYEMSYDGEWNEAHFWLDPLMK